MSPVPKISLRIFTRPPDTYILYIIACFEVAFERFHGIRLDKREALEHLRRKAAIQQNVSAASDSRRTHPVTPGFSTSAHGVDVSPNFAILDYLVDKRS